MQRLLHEDTPVLPGEPRAMSCGNLRAGKRQTFPEQIYCIILHAVLSSQNMALTYFAQLFFIFRSHIIDKHTNEKNSAPRKKCGENNM